MKVDVPASKRRKLSSSESRPAPVSVAQHHKPASKDPPKRSKGKRTGSKFDEFLQITATEVSFCTLTTLHAIHFRKSFSCPLAILCISCLSQIQSNEVMHRQSKREAQHCGCYFVYCLQTLALV